jgi:hypothetical protein
MKNDITATGHLTDRITDRVSGWLAESVWRLSRY